MSNWRKEEMLRRNSAYRCSFSVGGNRMASWEVCSLSWALGNKQELDMWGPRHLRAAQTA